MTFSTVLETFVSLTVQVTLLIGVGAWFVRKQEFKASSDSCWATLHVCILALTCCAFFLPHLRLIKWADLQPSAGHPLAHAASSIVGRICGWLWASGAVAIVAVCAGGIFRATKLVQSADDDESVTQSLRKTVPEFTSVARPVGIRILSAVVSPFCWQMHSPVIVLPDIVRDFPAAEQAAIVRHELAHLRLQHPLHLFLQRLVEAIYWFHPLVWWASQQAAAAREFRCDQEAVNSRAEVADYLRSLLRLIESQVRAPGHLPAGLGFLGDSSLLSRRANMLADSLDHSTKLARRWRASASLIFASALFSLVWLPVNPAASPRAEWSPWPSWSAQALNAGGVSVRDYEVDGHRLNGHSHSP